MPRYFVWAEVVVPFPHGAIVEVYLGVQHKGKDVE